MSIVDNVEETNTVPLSQIRFEIALVEDAIKSAQEGHYVAKEVHYVHVKVPGSMDIWKQKVDAWFKLKQEDVKNDRIPQKHLDIYKEAYARWKQGQEMPLHGMPIKGWGVISPAQQETLIRLNVLTVEELSKLNDEGMRRVGMGSLDLKNKAIAALTAAKDTGTLVIENASLKKRLDAAEKNQEEMSKQISALMAQTGHQPVNVPIADVGSIEIGDIMDSAKPEPRRPTKTQKSETIGVI